MDSKLRLHDRKSVANMLQCSVRQTYRFKDMPKPIVLGRGDNAKRLFIEADLRDWIESKKQGSSN